MTDIGPSYELETKDGYPVPARLGMTAELRDGVMTGELTALPETMVHGALRASALVYLVDAVGGIAIDTDPDMWSFTSDLSVRIPAMPAPERVLAWADVLRVGRRSATVAVPLTLADGTDLGVGLTGFARVPRRDTDPPKPNIDAVMLAEAWATIPPLDVPLREAAGLRVVDASAGDVELVLRADLLNPAGALQGAMVALVAEAAAELATAAIGSPQIVTDIDIRYLAQARQGPLRTRARFVGPPADGSVVVDIIDPTLDDKLVTVVTLRTRPAPS